VSKCVQF